MAILRTLITAAFFVAALLVVTVVALWPTVVRLGIEADLSVYAREVRQADCSLEDKQRLLDLVEGIEDRVRTGEQIGLMRWLKCDEAVRDLMADGISGDDLALVERELQRAEQELRSKQEQ